MVLLRITTGVGIFGFGYHIGVSFPLSSLFFSPLDALASKISVTLISKGEEIFNTNRPHDSVSPDFILPPSSCSFLSRSLAIPNVSCVQT